MQFLKLSIRCFDTSSPPLSHRFSSSRVDRRVLSSEHSRGNPLTRRSHVRRQSVRSRFSFRSRGRWIAASLGCAAESISSSADGEGVGMRGTIARVPDDHGGRRWKQWGLSRCCALRIQNKRWRRRRTLDYPGGPPPWRITAAASNQMNPLPKQAWSTAGFSRTMNYSVRANVFIPCSLLCSPAREAARRIVEGKDQDIFPSPFARREREKFPSTLRHRRSWLYRWRQFYLAPRPQSPLPRSPFNLMSHIMRHMERNFRHDTVRITRIGGSDDIYSCINITRTVDRSYSRWNRFFIPRNRFKFIYSK